MQIANPHPAFHVSGCGIRIFLLFSFFLSSLFLLRVLVSLFFSPRSPPHHPCHLWRGASRRETRQSKAPRKRDGLKERAVYSSPQLPRRRTLPDFLPPFFGDFTSFFGDCAILQPVLTGVFPNSPNRNPKTYPHAGLFTKAAAGSEDMA